MWAALRGTAIEPPFLLILHQLYCCRFGDPHTEHIGSCACKNAVRLKRIDDQKVLLAQHKKLFVFHHLGRTAQHIDHRKPLCPSDLMARFIIDRKRDNIFPAALELKHDFASCQKQPYRIKTGMAVFLCYAK